MTRTSVTIQITPESKPAMLSWFAEVAAFAQVLSHMGVLKTIEEQVRFARARFGTYELIDFVVVLIGSALSGEPTLLAFYERLDPFAEAYMALGWRATNYPIAQPYPAFSLPLISRPWKFCVRSFRRTCLRARRFPLPVAWLIEQVDSGW